MFDVNETLLEPEQLEPEVNRLIARFFGFDSDGELSTIQTFAKPIHLSTLPVLRF
ncbi:hypothetical protein ACFL6C_12345 [Myxococcota bacterium]